MAAYRKVRGLHRFRVFVSTWPHTQPPEEVAARRLVRNLAPSCSSNAATHVRTCRKTSGQDSKTDRGPHTLSLSHDPYAPSAYRNRRIGPSGLPTSQRSRSCTCSGGVFEDRDRDCVAAMNGPEPSASLGSRQHAHSWSCCGSLCIGCRMRCAS
jgi:hypothetical protein